MQAKPLNPENGEARWCANTDRASINDCLQRRQTMTDLNFICPVVAAQALGMKLGDE